jgi:mycothiol synthase
MSGVLSPDFVTRPPIREDAQAIANLIALHDMTVLGAVTFELSELLGDWEAPQFDLTKDARMVVAPDGSIVGYETVFRVFPNGLIKTDGYVHPAYVGQGIGTHLLNWAESRAREHMPEFDPALSVSLQAGFLSTDTLAHPLFESLGYRIVRHYWNMEIDLAEMPAAPVWPDEIFVRLFEPEHDNYRVWAAISEAFKDHWGMAPISFDEWMASETPDLDPTLSFLAMAGDEVAGVSLCNFHLGDGKVLWLGIRPLWRRLGLGMALLKYSFSEFYRRGTTKVALRVDAQNATGATQLYERAGMHVTQRFDIYRKELRTGRIEY